MDSEKKGIQQQHLPQHQRPASAAAVAAVAAVGCGSSSNMGCAGSKTSASEPADSEPAAAVAPAAAASAEQAPAIVEQKPGQLKGISMDFGGVSAGVHVLQQSQPADGPPNNPKGGTSRSGLAPGI